MDNVIISNFRLPSIIQIKDPTIPVFGKPDIWVSGQVVLISDVETSSSLSLAHQDDTSV